MPPEFTSKTLENGYHEFINYVRWVYNGNETIPDSVADGIYFRMVAVALKKVQNSC